MFHFTEPCLVKRNTALLYSRVLSNKPLVELMTASSNYSSTSATFRVSSDMVANDFLPGADGSVVLQDSGLDVKGASTSWCPGVLAPLNPASSCFPKVLGNQDGVIARTGVWTAAAKTTLGPVTASRPGKVDAWFISNQRKLSLSPEIGLSHSTVKLLCAHLKLR